MHISMRRINDWARAALLAVWWLSTPLALQGQEISSGSAAALPLPADVEPEKAPAVVSEGPAEDGSKCEEPPSLWARVPPVQPIPRTGWFLIPPSGPGYYSFLDWLTDHYREKPPVFPTPPISLFFGTFFENADYRYLDKPDNTQHDWLDPLKRIHLGDCWLLSLGGEERFRLVNEVDSRLTGLDNNYDLLRTRLYADLWYKDLFRVYVEYIDAQSFNQDLPPLKIDVNHSDFQNLFAELKVWEIDDKPVYVRGGRQELLYGSERLISPLEWANTRRTFQGVKTYWHSDKLDIDAFWAQPVLVDPTHLDPPDHNQQFYGVWTTYRPQKGQAIDLYYLLLDQSSTVGVGRYGARGGYDVNTFGSRYAGDYCQKVLWDVEGMYQCGDFVNQAISAGAVTVGLGYHFAELPLDPQFWIYNDWASGDHNPGATNIHGTFNQLFPFAHLYFGFIDDVGRQNIDDLNMQFSLRPAPWVLSLVQYHIFRLDAAKDALYNAAGTPIRRDPTGRAGTDVGDELDWVINFHMTTHQDIFLGYSKLFAGEFIKRTGNPGSPELFYLQYSYRW